MHKYKTSEFAQLLGVGVETLRHYEKWGLISPQINPENGYRTYTDADALQFFSIKMHRSIDMSIPEIEKLMKQGSLEDEERWLQGKMMELEARIMRLQMLIARNKKRLKGIRKVQQDIGKVTELKLPPVYHLIYEDLRELQPAKRECITRNWMNGMPFVNYLLVLEMNEILNNSVITPRLGLSARLHCTEEFDLHIAPPIRMRLGGHGLQMSITTLDPFSIGYRELEPMQEYARRIGCVLSGDVSCMIDAIDYTEEPLYYVFLRFQIANE